jgi:mono/diheme cytochrome c family protein
MRSFAKALVALFSSIIFLAGCYKAPAGPVPLDQLNAQQQRGHGVFMAHCSICHYDRVDQPMYGPSLYGVYKKPYLHSGAPANDDRVTATILHGRNMMPAQPNLSPAYSPGDLDDLIAYLHTL